MTEALILKGLLLLFIIWLCAHYLVNIWYTFTSVEGIMTKVFRIVGIFVPLLGIVLGFFKPKSCDQRD